MRHEWGHKATNVKGSAFISASAAQACMQMFFAECLIEARDFLSQSNCEKCHFRNGKEASLLKFVNIIRGGVCTECAGVFFQSKKLSILFHEVDG